MYFRASNCKVSMRYNYLFALLITFIAQVCVFGQQRDIDSLAEKSYAELKALFYEYLPKDKKVAEKVARYTLNKAAKKRNYEAVANAYIRLHRVFIKDIPQAIKYVDSSLRICNIYDFKELQAENFNNLGNLEYRSYNYDKALEYYLKARKYFKKTNNKSFYFTIQHNIANLKLKVRAHKEALTIFKECLDYIEENKEEKIISFKYLGLLRSISSCYALEKKFDSVSWYNKKGYSMAKAHPNFNELVFTHLEGGNQYLKGNYEVAEDSIIKALPYLKNLASKGDLAIAYGHLGRMAKLDGEIEKSVFYFKMIDTIYTTTKYRTSDPRQIYEYLIDYYKNKGDLKQQLYYTEQLIGIDSVLTKDYSALNKTFKENDLSNLKIEKEKLVFLLSEEKTTFKRNTMVLSVIILLLVPFFIYLYIKKINNEKRFHQIINELKLKKEKPEIVLVKKATRAILGIDQKLIDQILEGLKAFEENNDYLKPKLSLNKLAKDLNTNSKYLSKVINKFKSKTFNNYVNDLRIEYVMQELQGNSQFKNYTIKAIAEEVGFTNTETFTKAFYKKTGIKPSYFINELSRIKNAD